MSVSAPTPYDVLVEHGIINTAMAHFNAVITVPRAFEMEGEWKLPSRLFRHPVGIVEQQLRLKHPLLSEHPYVRELQSLTGESISYTPPAYADHSTWHHAVDLAMDGFYDELLSTRAYTTDENIVGALSFALCYRNDDPRRILSLKKARDIAKRLGLKEPADRSSVIKSLSEPNVVKGENGVRYPVNGIRLNSSAHLFAIMHGLEDGWLTHVGDHLQWTEAGRDFHAGRAFGLLL
jgi:hypothetical protein